MRIREFCINDLDDVMNIWLKSNIEVHYFISENYWKDNFDFVRKEIEKSEIYVCEENKKILGFAGVCGEYIAGIFILKDFRNRGIGKKLLDYLKSIKENLSLHVYEKNRFALKFYLRENFIVNEIKKDEITKENEVFMIWNKFENIIIREEKEEDFKKVYELIKESFKSAEHCDGNEQDLVENLRKGKSFIKELSLVAEIGGKIVGHILFSKGYVEDREVVVVGPLSVLPDYQRKGVGKALLNEGNRIAKELGYKYSMVLGSEKYYPKFGYVPAELYGIKPTFDVPSENFMALKLDKNAEKLNGFLKYAEEFGIN